MTHRDVGLADPNAKHEINLDRLTHAVAAAEGEAAEVYAALQAAFPWARKGHIRQAAKQAGDDELAAYAAAQR
jgi:hypothetical protein